MRPRRSQSLIPAEICLLSSGWIVSAQQARISPSRKHERLRGYNGRRRRSRTTLISVCTMCVPGHRKSRDRQREQRLDEWLQCHFAEAKELGKPRRATTTPVRCIERSTAYGPREKRLLPEFVGQFADPLDDDGDLTHRIFH